MQLVLAKSEYFGSVKCDFWKDASGEIFMTREQIGTALEYSEPTIAISKLHARYKDRLDKFSTLTKLVNVEGSREVERDNVVYSAKGIYEICRWSRQPKADDFYDMVYDILESLRKGESVIVNKRDSYMIDDRVERAKRWIEEEQERKMLVAANEEKEKIINELKPKASYCELVLQSKSLVATTIIAKDYGMYAQFMNKLLHELGIQYKVGDCWVLYQKYAGNGYTQTKTQVLDEEKTKDHTYWTQKGRMFIYEFLKGQGTLPLIERAA